MPSTHSSPIIHYWAGKYPGSVGWLIGPMWWKKTKLREWIPYALDNDAFIAWTKKTRWDEAAYFEMLQRASAGPHRPMWALVPDVVADRNATIALFEKYASRVSEFGFSLAFAVQDGMSPDDVPDGVDVVFVGGSTEWKWRNARIFCDAFPRVHIGRVNTIDRLWLCKDMGAESVDGSGWFRDGEDAFRLRKLENFFLGKRECELFNL